MSDELLKELRNLSKSFSAGNVLTKAADALEKAIATIEELLKNPSDDICAYCKNLIVCCPNTCDSFDEGKGGTWDGKYHPDFKWKCTDIEYGTCDKMKDTKCNGCFDNNYSGFEWEGK